MEKGHEADCLGACVDRSMCVMSRRDLAKPKGCLASSQCRCFYRPYAICMSYAMLCYAIGCSTMQTRSKKKLSYTRKHVNL